ncbi:MAG: hypothetical protein AB1921_09305 [Thermodesulfobacteriota bacterium]
MPQHILLVLDGGGVHGESFFYARELAKRMELPLRVLLLDRSQVPAAERKRSSEILETILTAARAYGLSAEGQSRYGDQGSELLKYLAASPGTRCMVWGGDPDVLKPGRRRQASHWLSKVRESLDWPIAGAVGKEEGNQQAAKPAKVRHTARSGGKNGKTAKRKP